MVIKKSMDKYKFILIHIIVTTFLIVYIIFIDYDTFWLKINPEK